MSAEILVTSDSILYLKSERSAGSRGTYTQSCMNTRRKKSQGVRSGECGGHAIQALTGGSLQPIYWWEIAVVVEYQDRQNQVQLVNSYSLGHPVLLPLQRHLVVSNMIPANNVIIIWRLTAELNTDARCTVIADSVFANRRT
ncbi:hypothetical protein TNCV_1340671 [Trichonephila clavipes]|nr:hypothetical protein TNCV_1340671 [Trichonephila clavipes]